MQPYTRQARLRASIPPPKPASARWDNPELRAAAAAYCAGQMPPPFFLDSPEGARWCLDCAARLAPQLGLSASKLGDILREWRPPPRPMTDAHPDDWDSPEDREAADSAALIASGMALEPETALAALLSEEEWSLRETEREELACALDQGLPLDAPQRLALSMMLRGSAAADRAGLARGILHWLCPRLTVPRWKRHSAQVTLNDPCRVEVLPALRALDTPHHTLNRQHVRLTEEDGGRTLVFFHASACALKDCSGGRRRFTVRSLEPDGNRHDDESLRKNLTLLTAFVSHNRTHGAAWARTFGETRAMVSHRRHRINDALNKTTGGRAVLPGMRAHAHPLKGTVKASPSTHNHSDPDIL